MTLFRLEYRDERRWPVEFRSPQFSCLLLKVQTFFFFFLPETERLRALSAVLPRRKDIQDTNNTIGGGFKLASLDEPVYTWCRVTTVRWKMGVLWLHRKETLVCRPLANRVSLVSPLLLSLSSLCLYSARSRTASGRQHNAMTQRRRVAVITRLQTRNGQRQWRLNRTMKTRRLFAEQRPGRPGRRKIYTPRSTFYLRHVKYPK